MIWIAAIVGAVLALPLAGMLALGRRVPVVLGALPGGIVLLSAVLLVVPAASSAGLGRLPVPLTLPLMAGRLEGVDADLTWTGIAIALPVGLLLIGSAVAALRSASKQGVTPVLGVLLVLSWSAGFFRDVVGTHPDAQLTGVFLGVVLGLIASVGLVGADPDDNGPDAAGVAAMAYATALVGIAIGFRAADTALLYAALSQIDAADTSRLFTAGQAIAMLLEGRGWLTCCWGAAFALLGLGTAALPEGPRRVGAGVAAALLAPIVGTLAATSTQPAYSSFLLQLADRVTARPSRDYQLPVAEHAEPVGLNSTLRVTRRQVLLDGAWIADLKQVLDDSGKEHESVEDPAVVTEAIAKLAAQYRARPYDGALTLAIDRRTRFLTLLTLAEAARAGGATRFDARVLRGGGSDGALSVQLDPAPDPVPPLDGHDPYPLRLQLLPDQVHLFVRSQRIELDCLGACEQQEFAVTVLEQLAEAEPGEPEVLLIPYRDQSWASLVFWLTVQPQQGEPLLGSRVLGTPAWVPALVGLDVEEEPE